MLVLPTDLPGVVVVEPTIFHDDRGWFMETFNEPRFHRELVALGLPEPRPFVQDNHSCSRKAVLRGLHYQRKPHEQGKLVRVTSGAVWDVAVDIRPESASFGRWVGVELSARNRRQLWIPEGFAHGFLSLCDGTEVVYKTTDVYSKPCDAALLWNDPSIGIEWPLNRVGGEPVLSEKDQLARRFGE